VAIVLQVAALNKRGVREHRYGAPRAAHGELSPREARRRGATL